MQTQKNEKLIEYLVSSNPHLFPGDKRTVVNTLLAVASPGMVGELVEKHVANKRGTYKLKAGTKGMDLADGTETKFATRSGRGIKVGGLKHKGEAKRIVMIIDDVDQNGEIFELTVTPDEIRNVDGTMPQHLNINKETMEKFADRKIVLASF